MSITRGKGGIAKPPSERRRRRGRRWRDDMKHLGKKLLVSGLVLVLSLLVPELLCRLCGYPRGTFAAFFPDGARPYPPNRTLRLTWGAVPYVVRSNAQGFRGEDIAARKRSATLRILTIGDSMTDGFFVDNEATWQFGLQNDMRHRLGAEVEVVNGARGGGSIDKELAMLKSFLRPLAPDLVILTFVSNDISEIRGVSLDELLNLKLGGARMTMAARARRFVFAQTGLGEFLFHLYLTARSPSYAERPRETDIRLDDRRYAIPGGANFAENVGAFRKRYGDKDGLVLGDRFSDETEAAFGKYVVALKEFAAVCRAADAELIFVYFPAYSQVYDAEAARYVNDRLRSACESAGLCFLDLTDGFRAHGANRVLHLAPVDYHLNPEGNAVFAGLVADFLTGSSPAGVRITQRFASPGTERRSEHAPLRR